MTGSLGMVASTVPVQALLPVLGWRGLFWAVAGLLLLAAALVAWVAPRGTARSVEGAPAGAAGSPTADIAYAQIVRHPLFVRMAPLAFVVYGGLIAVQSLWAGPWLTRVSGWTPAQAAQGLFGINLAMLVAFGAWGLAMPRLVRRGFTPQGLVAWGVPLSFVMLACIVLLGSSAGAVHWALWCVACTFVSVSQPAVGAAFPAEQAGRALSAFNLVIFGGVFCIQWGLGLLIDLLRAWSVSEASAFRAAMATLGLCGVAAHAWFLRCGHQAANNRA